MILKYLNSEFVIAPQTWRILMSLDENYEFGCYDIEKDGSRMPTVKESRILKLSEIKER